MKVKITNIFQCSFCAGHHTSSSTCCKCTSCCPTMRRSGRWPPSSRVSLPSTLPLTPSSISCFLPTSINILGRRQNWISFSGRKLVMIPFYRLFLETPGCDASCAAAWARRSRRATTARPPPAPPCAPRAPWPPPPAPPSAGHTGRGGPEHWPVNNHHILVRDSLLPDKVSTVRFSTATIAAQKY